MDKSIAEKWLKAFDEHEKSWNGKDYTGKTTDEIFFDKLSNEEKQTGFAICVMSFGWQWSNDIIDICNNIIESKDWWANYTENKCPDCGLLLNEDGVCSDFDCNTR